ncbi:L,D-transpeptidase catalytic domain [bacterium A37T11]|nr:L,D-transpeptidase catalytic domain [bacterium A37T11]
MMNTKRSTLLLSFCLLAAAVVTISSSKSALTDHKPTEVKYPKASAMLSEVAMNTYLHCNLSQAELDSNVFKKACIGFFNLKARGKVAPSPAILTIADLSLSSKKKRLWVIDLEHQRLLMHTWVAHGQGSGGDIATQFSNDNESHQSSLGFYVTGEVYQGKHGRSLRLDGMDKGFNDHARERAIVLHGAPYVSGQAIRNLARLGRSFGCPAVPTALSDQIINLIKGKTVLFVYAKTADYRSAYLDENAANNLL